MCACCRLFFFGDKISFNRMKRKILWGSSLLCVFRYRKINRQTISCLFVYLCLAERKILLSIVWETYRVDGLAHVIYQEREKYMCYTLSEWFYSSIHCKTNRIYSSIWKWKTIKMQIKQSISKSLGSKIVQGYRMNVGVWSNHCLT